MAKNASKDTAPEPISEEEIAAKVYAGLSRDQAIEVINNQRANDALLAE